MYHSTKVNTVTRGIRLSIIIGLLALLALLTGLLAVTQPAQANNYEVTNSIDGEPGSLRQAITDANINLGPDTITFAASTNGTPIILTGTVDEDANAGGDLDILDGGDLTIQGNGAANTIIDGGGIDRVFHVCPGAGCTNSVTFNGVTIRNGSTGNGAGIDIEAGTVTIDSSAIISNTAALDGGGIYNKGTLIVQNGSLIGGDTAGNTATVFGGGISNRAGGTTTVDGSSVSHNTAKFGGGISDYGTLTVQNGSTIGGVGAGNTATKTGGGIYNAVGTTTVTGSTVSANTSGQACGGIFNSGTLIIQNGSTIGGVGAGNTAVTDGAGIFNGSGTMMVEDSTVTANIADRIGGGIINTGTMTVTGSIISSNSADEGGGISNHATLIVQNGTVIGGPGAGNTADYGGGIINRGTITVTGSTISDNSADYGGGIYNQAGTTTVTGSSILYNTTKFSGGGLYNHNDITKATSVTGSCIVGNSDKSFYNSRDATQIATGNWWGAAGGPNTVGADTVDGNVDVGGHLPAPIPGCLPDLQVAKGNDTDGYGIVGTTFHWTLSISNTGYFSSTFDAGQPILVDELPAGPTYGTPVTGSVVDVSNSDEILCEIAGDTLTCEADGADVTLGPLTGSFEVVFPVTQDAPATLVNPVNPDGVCQVDPDGNVTEDNEDNNDCAENVVTVLDLPDLQVGKGNDTDGNGVVGTPFNWILTISNTGPSNATFADLQTILKDELPAGPAYGTPVAGSFVDITNSAKILCDVTSNTLTCKASGGNVTLGPLTGSFEVTLPVTPNAPAILTNPVSPAGVCQVDPDANVPENDDDNNDCPENVVTILDLPDLQVGKANDTGGTGVVGTLFNWTLTISNTGPTSATFAELQTILKDDLPAGPTYGDPVAGSFLNVANSDKIKCSLDGDTLTCKASGGNVTLGPLTGSFEVTLPVTPDVPATLVNPVNPDGICQVDPDGNMPENDDDNNDCSENVVTVIDLPDLQVGKVNDTSGNGKVGIPFHWTLTISNTGPSSATFASGDTILIDDLPTGPAYDDPVIGTVVNVTNGDKIQCGLAADTLTCTADGADVIFGGVDSFFDVTFSVTPDAPVPIVNPDTDGICKVNPGGKVTESDESNNDCPANTVDVSVSANYLYLPAVMK